MLEVTRNVPSQSNIIDTFTISLSTPLNNHVVSYTGRNNISVIDLSYHLFCMDSEDCPRTTTLPVNEETVQGIASYVYLYIIQTTLLCMHLAVN